MIDATKTDRIQNEATASEVELLGSMLHGQEFIEQVIGIVDVEDFKDKNLAKLFHAFTILHGSGKPIYNLPLLAAEMRRMNADENICTQAYLNRIFSSVVNAAHIIYHAEHVRYASHKRKLARLATKIMETAFNDGATTEQQDISTLEREVNYISNVSVPGGAKTVEQVAIELVQEIERESSKPHRKPGIFTGLISHDSVTGPLMPGELCVLAARPGCGKTALAMQWATHVAERRKRTLFISLEMKDRELVGRMLSPLAEVESLVIRSQQADEMQLERLKNATTKLHGLPLVVWDQNRATMRSIRGIVKHTQATGGIEALFVDYLGLIKMESNQRGIPRHEQIAEVTAEMKTIAKEIEIPIVLLCQLNREADGTAPKLSNLRESGAIEQDADMVIFIHHDEKKNTDRYSDVKTADIIVAKNRHGAVGTSTLFWNPQRTEFTEQREWQP